MDDNKRENYDLDALAPSPVVIKLGGKDINVPPPSTANILRLGFLARALGDADGEDAEKTEAAVSKLVQHLNVCIPAVRHITLNLAQIQKLVAILSDMAMPADAKELESRGITTSDPKGEGAPVTSP